MPISKRLIFIVPTRWCVRSRIEHRPVPWYVLDSRFSYPLPASHPACALYTGTIREYVAVTLRFLVLSLLLLQLLRFVPLSCVPLSSRYDRTSAAAVYSSNVTLFWEPFLFSGCFHIFCQSGIQQTFSQDFVDFCILGPIMSARGVPILCLFLCQASGPAGQKQQAGDKILKSLVPTKFLE